MCIVVNMTSENFSWLMWTVSDVTKLFVRVKPIMLNLLLIHGFYTTTMVHVWQVNKGICSTEIFLCRFYVLNILKSKLYIYLKHMQSKHIQGAKRVTKPKHI